MCFTRSSPLVHTIPAQFPHLTMTETQQDLATVKKTLSDLVLEDTDKLVMYKLSNLQSQSSVQDLLRDFVSSDSTEVCVLLANMQETTCKTINHIRIMIEEAELHTPDQHCKVFVLLLHFPVAQFFQHCYPTLFLKGWDHCYLDTVAQSPEEGIVDIRYWFYKCCFSDEDSNPAEPDTLLQALTQLLPQAISVLSARIYFGSKMDGSFNSAMNATQRSSALKTLLFEKGVGKVLCDKFRGYWKPKIMAEYLERAATFSKQRESTLNITDSIQTRFKALFMDFCVCMLTQANENFNLDIVYADNVSSPTHKLFIDILRIFPTPKLHQLNFLSNNLPTLKPPVHCPRFPFFSYVYKLMEEQVNCMRNGAGKLKLDVSTNTVESTSSKEQQLLELIQSILTDLRHKLQVSAK